MSGMENMMATVRNDDQREAAEQTERREMFSFDPRILGDIDELPRRSNGSAYSRPATSRSTRESAPSNSSRLRRS